MSVQEQKMKKLLNLILVGFLFISNYGYAQSIESLLQTAIDSIYNENPTSVGIMMHIESPEKGISWSGASGYSDKSDKIILEADQPALIASNTKTYVSAAILRLVEENRLSIHQPIKSLLFERTRKLFEQGGYDLDSIMVKHLLSQTGGINNYANQDYIDFINNNKTYRWTRDEQLELTVKIGAPLAKPGTQFNYTDANYILLTEIIENIYRKPFYTAIRDLLQYESLGFYDTWMPTLEEKPNDTKPLVHQYWGKYDWDSYEIDISVDLYGGGGIASTTKDMACFAYKLLNYGIVKDTTVLNLIYTQVPTEAPEPSNYYFGLGSYEYQGLTAYGHGGFWGTKVLYFPDLKTSIAVCVLEKEKQGSINAIIDKTIGILIE